MGQGSPMSQRSWELEELEEPDEPEPTEPMLAQLLPAQAEPEPAVVANVTEAAMNTGNLGGGLSEDVAKAAQAAVATECLDSSAATSVGAPADAAAFGAQA